MWIFIPTRNGTVVDNRLRSTLVSRNGCQGRISFHCWPNFWRTSGSRRCRRVRPRPTSKLRATRCSAGGNLQKPKRGERSDGELHKNCHHHQWPVRRFGPDAIDIRLPCIGRKVARQRDACGGNAVVGRGKPRGICAGMVSLPLFDIYNSILIASSGQA